jgi:hypothetical protein
MKGSINNMLNATILNENCINLAEQGSPCPQGSSTRACMKVVNFSFPVKYSIIFVCHIL